MAVFDHRNCNCDACIVVAHDAVTLSNSEIFSHATFFVDDCSGGLGHSDCGGGGDRRCQTAGSRTLLARTNALAYNGHQADRIRQFHAYLKQQGVNPESLLPAGTTPPKTMNRIFLEPELLTPKRLGAGPAGRPRKLSDQRTRQRRPHGVDAPAHRQGRNVPAVGALLRLHDRDGGHLFEDRPQRKATMPGLWWTMKFTIGQWLRKGRLGKTFSSI